MPYSIKEIADLAGVSTRTLRYYDEIDLLQPAGTGNNKYRYYNKDSLLKLQQILFYRELEVPLKEIHRLINHPDFDQAAALERHRSAIQGKINQLNTLVETIDQTIAVIQGEWIMTDKEYFDGFDEEKYEKEAKERWGHTNKYAVSQKRWKSYSKEQQEAIKQEGGEITRRMVGEDPELSPDDPSIQAAVGDYFDYINKHFYPCDVEFYRVLADNWVADPRFAKNYDRIRAGGADFVRKAVHIFCDQQLEE